MQCEIMAVGPLQVNASIIWDEETLDAIVVDPGGDGDMLLAFLKDRKLNAKYLINTHGHFDHTGANAFLKDTTDAVLCIHPDDLPALQNGPTHAQIYGLTTTASPEPDHNLKDGETIECGNLSFRVVHTPGHSPGGICLLGHGYAITGDTLFAGSVGRTDLPGGSMDTLIASIKKHLLPLADETIVVPGHGPDSTIGREKQMNPFLQPGGY